MLDLRLTLRDRVARHPWLYFPLLHLFRSPRRRLHVTPRTELVIEGYPRSGNTFAVAAFLQAQGRPVALAHHLHAPAQVVQAVRWGIPVLVLLRAPEDAALSWMIREPLLTARRALTLYLSFYRGVQPYREGFVLARFEQVVQDFGVVIRRLNQKFGTAFRPFVPTEANLEQVWRMVEAMDMADTGRARVTETTVARPSPVREQLKARCRALLQHAQVRPLLAQAQALYRALAAGADV